ncbi:DUF4062 domain-containing protein [Magnetospirillum sp. UT-4]|uniref:DUF4062 domain-containing protein n=1 Tax=Magnetospirillum sp. UT-4 TaxID=2681467 RepID=UPI0020C4FEF1|nr:DUF4062 domain-containing protein [Magnetospirillum sp. UT-4]
MSSTCYDLSVIRGQLRQFIENLGHEPVMSDYNDVLFDPREHTHTSCIDEVAGADAVVVIIGSRFGGKSVPSALQKVDLEGLAGVSKSNELLKAKDNISVTQLEVLKAVERSVPVFAFVDERVMHDHATYERNKGKPIADLIEYSSIEKLETAKYIFEFINFLRHRVTNNGITTFNKLQDIEDALKKQWSGLFQKLLLEQRAKQQEGRRIDALTEQFEDLKAAILTAVGGSKNEKEVARGVVRFRKLLDLLMSFDLQEYSFLFGPAIPWSELLRRIEVVDFLRVSPVEDERGIRRPVVRWIRADGTFYEVDRMFDPADMSSEWDAFMRIDEDSRAVIYDALAEMRSIPARRFVRHIPLTPEEADERNRQRVMPEFEPAT